MERTKRQVRDVYPVEDLGRRCLRGMLSDSPSPLSLPTKDDSIVKIKEQKRIISFRFLVCSFNKGKTKEEMNKR